MPTDEKGTGGPRDPADDRQAVLRFAEEMLKKLAENTHKQHWATVSMDYLLERLEIEATELRFAIEHEPASAIISECADVANFAMMIADNLRN